MGTGNGTDDGRRESLTPDSNLCWRYGKVSIDCAILLQGYIFAEGLGARVEEGFSKTWALPTPYFLSARIGVIQVVVGGCSHGYLGGSYHLASPPNGFGLGPVPY